MKQKMSLQNHLGKDHWKGLQQNVKDKGFNMEWNKLFFKSLLVFKSLFFITFCNKGRKDAVSCFYCKFIEELVNIISIHNIMG